MTAFPQAVIEAAWFEARQRERAYPKLVLLKAVDDLIAEKGEDAARMQRRASLVVIHQAVAFQREWLSETNRQLREQAEARIAARAKAAA
jgi:hypothetical protein